MKSRATKFFTLVIIPLLITCKSPNDASSTKITANEVSAESRKANDFFDRSFNRMLERHPMYASYLGEKTNYDKWGDVSDTFAQFEIGIIKAELSDSLKMFDFNKLDENTQISYRLFQKNAMDKIEAFSYRFNSYPINQEDGLHTEVPTFLINVHKIDSLGDAKAYISRLYKINRLFGQVIDNLKIREAKGVIAPRFVFPKVLAACRNVISGKPFDKTEVVSPLEEDFSRKIKELKGISQSTRDSLLREGDIALKVSVRPAYEKLIAYLTDLQKKATDVVGAWNMPDGDAFYKMQIRQITTTNMTPEEVYELGLKEVARIHGEIRVIMKKVGFKSDNVTDFFRYMTDPHNPISFFPNTQAGKQQYLDTATKYIADMKKRLDDLFITKPKADIVVKAVEEFREKSAGTAFYDQPSPDGTRPGRFYVNLYDMTQSPVYQLEALAYHEGIPGHHMQISIAQELKDVPKFRRFGEYTAYVEGWGLYAERIPKEIGFYKNPYSDFGRLSMELMRSARLVVDVGIHLNHWTREQAIKYFLDNTAEPPIECEHAIERYIVWPGQATAYKIGMNKILELRELAQNKLGDKFNIREFHDVVLTSGALPLDILEENVNKWINRKLKA